MFIQVIEGHTNDEAALTRQLEAWGRELAPGAIGYLGSTAGVTEAGDAVLIARFESAEAAKANSDRPEQTAWWAETERCFSGPVRFHDTTDVSDMRHGDLDKATFVQVMEGHISDRDRAKDLERRSDSMLAEVRPDLLGVVTAFFDDGEFAEVAYFKSEAEARAAESQPPPGAAAAMVDEWMDVMKVERYLDLTHPQLMTA